MVPDHEGLVALKPLRAFSQFFIGFMTEPSLKVSKGIEIGNKFDEAFFAVVVNLSDFFPGEGREFFPDFLMVLKGKGMFDVELDFIEPKQAEKVDEFKNRVHGWHFASTDIEHKCPSTKYRAVINLKARDGLFRTVKNLFK